MSFPCIKINLRKISNNARLINDRCALKGISVVAVTKSILADIEIVKILKKSGINILDVYKRQTYARSSGFTRIVKVKNRIGDGAEIAQIELLK